MKSGYQTDLAYIHDAGFTDFMRKSAPALLSILRRSQIKHGLVVDLGCGSGVWAEQLVAHGYQVLGIEISPAMLRIARQRAPRARFINASLFRARLPACAAVTAIGECLNYAFDRSGGKRLDDLFRRIYKALDSGGVFIFDVAEPGRVGPTPVQSFFQGKDWAILVRNEEDTKRKLLSRRMTIFRRMGRTFRRSEEVHKQNLLEPSRVKHALKILGFKVTNLLRYGTHRLGTGRSIFIARKP